MAASARALGQARATELATALLAIALYLPTIEFGFVFDDVSLIAPDGSPVAVGGTLPYRPLRYASYLLDSWLGGTPAIYHAHNVLLHALVAALVVALARRLGSARTAAMAGGLLVAVHPLAVEAAAYVAGRRDLLCVAFGLAALLAHLSGRLVSALLLVVLATAAKESGLVFLAPLLAATVVGLDGQAERRSDDGSDQRGAPRSASGSEPVGGSRAHAAPSQRRVVITAAAIALAGVSALALAVAYGAIGPWAPASGAVGLALPGRMAAHYVGAFVGIQALAPEYPQLLRFVERVQGGDMAALLSGSVATLALVMAAAAALTACVRARTGGNQVFAFVSAWTMSVLVALSLWGGLHEPGADRHAYLLLAPAGVALAATLSRLFQSAGSFVAMFRLRHRMAPVVLRSTAVAAVALTLVGSASASRAQMQVWRSERALWTHASAHESASSRAHANMARSLAAGGRYRAAARQMNAALAVAPADSGLYVGRAALRCAQGRRFLARRDLKAAQRLGAPAPLVGDVANDCGFAAT